MAKIDVQHKRPIAWRWILGFVVLLVLVVWAAMEMTDGDSSPLGATAPPTPSNEAAPDEAAPPEVAAFLTFVEAPADSPVGIDHQYAADGIRRLSNALKTIVDDQPDVGGRAKEALEEFRSKADRIQQDSESLQHADQVREVFTGAATLMSVVQEARWPDAKDLESRVAQVESAAEALRGDRPLLDQSTAVKEFFDKAAGAVRAMSERPT